MRFFICLLFALLCLPVSAAELLIFTAEWCGPCRAFKADYANDATIVGPFVDNTSVFDADKEKELAKLYSVTSVPTFLVLEHGKVLRKQAGYEGPAHLKKWLENGNQKQRTKR